MYVNTIKFKGEKVSEFVTSEETFSPYNPTYKRVQEVLEEMGWTPECNHVFKGGMGNLHFLHTEVDTYCPGKFETQYLWEQRKHLGSASSFIFDLEMIFLKNIKLERVEYILK